MSLWKTYAQPTSVEEALQLLHGCKGPTAVIAGGTDLLLDMQQGRHPPVELMVDVTCIQELKQILIAEGMLHIGAGVTHREILDSSLLREHAACLVTGCGLIGGPQVRNVATIGGNVAHALPAGDGTIALMALEAEAQLATASGRTWLPLTDFFQGPGVPRLDRSRELLVGFRIPARRSHESSAFKRVMRPQGVAIAILNAAVWIRSEAGLFDGIRVAMGPGGPRPFRAFQTEAFLEGRAITNSSIQQASQVLLNEIKLRTSRHRATEGYRKHLAPTLLADTLRAALDSLELGQTASC